MDQKVCEPNQIGSMIKGNAEYIQISPLFVFLRTVLTPPPPAEVPRGFVGVPGSQWRQQDLLLFAWCRAVGPLRLRSGLWGRGGSGSLGGKEEGGAALRGCIGGQVCSDQLRTRRAHRGDWGPPAWDGLLLQGGGEQCTGVFLCLYLHRGEDRVGKQDLWDRAMVNTESGYFSGCGSTLANT